MIRAIFAFLSTCILLASCTQRMVCPAYQSAFIYDKNELRKKFSYFEADSSPKVFTASKNKYLVAEHVSYQRKVRSLQTVAMKPIPVHVPDSISGKGGMDSVFIADLDRAARSVIDSTYIVDVPKKDSLAAPLDSIYVITKDKELRLLKYDAPDSLDYDSATNRYVPQAARYYVKEVRYNLEQDHYMWYLRKSLILPDVRIAKQLQQEAKDEKAGKKKGGFFKNLFRKKQKVTVDSSALQAQPEADEFDYVDEVDEVDSTLQAEIPQPGQPQDEAEPKAEKKKLFGGKKKKKEKVKPNTDKKPTEPEPKPVKKEDEDDGF
jgi:hypothetical protein